MSKAKPIDAMMQINHWVGVRRAAGRFMGSQFRSRSAKSASWFSRVSSRSGYPPADTRGIYFFGVAAGFFEAAGFGDADDFAGAALFGGVAGFAAVPGAAAGGATAPGAGLASAAAAAGWPGFAPSAM